MDLLSNSIQEGLGDINTCEVGSATSPLKYGFGEQAFAAAHVHSDCIILGANKGSKCSDVRRDTTDMIASVGRTCLCYIL